MDNDDNSFPLLAQPEVTIDITTSPIGNNTNLVGVDNQTATSSITSVISTVTKSVSPSHVKHLLYTMLSGGNRKFTKAMPYCIKLIGKISSLTMFTYLPPMFGINPTLIKWHSTYTDFMKYPRKWICSLMANALCEFDLIVKVSRTFTVNISNSKLLPDPITEFETYMSEWHLILKGM